MTTHPLGRFLATAFSGSVLTVALLTFLAPAASGAQYGPTIEPLGPVEPVWINDYNPNDTPEQRNSKNACDGGALADLPAKAFRDDQNRVDMPTPNGEPPRVRAGGAVTWQGSHRMLGSDLNHLKPEQQTNYSDSRLCTSPKSNITHTNPFAPNFPCFRLQPSDTTCTDTVNTPSNRAAQWPPPPGYEPWKPETFHDYEWIDSPWAIGDGTTVIALLHDNYRGFEDLNGDGNANDDCHPPQNPPAGYAINYCWYASVTTAKSTDGGDTFGDPNDWTHADPPFYSGPPDHRAISSPYMYEPDQCCRQGVPEPTNIIKKGTYEYIMFKINLPPDAPASAGSKSRLCIARSGNVEDPSSWRGWDGDASNDAQDGYTVTFVNPYTYPFTSTDTREMHICSPVNAPISNPRTLVYSRYFHQYMLIGENSTNGVNSVYYTLSSDFIGWTPAQLLQENAIYGSIIDDDDPAASSSSSERNFYQPDQKAYLYVGGRVRTPIKFKAMRFATGAADGCPGGFDAHNGAVTPATGRNASGDDHAYLASSVGGSQVYSSFDKEDYPTSCGNPASDPVQVRDGSDVWYTGYFVFPSLDFDQQGKPVSNVTFFRLQNSSSAAGALSIRTDGRVHFVTDPNLSQSGDETELLQSGGQNGVPIANNSCWHSYEIHQKIGDASTTNEIWIDGQKQTTVQTAVDNYHGSPYSTYRAGIVDSSGSAPFSTWTDLVGIGHVGPLSFTGCRGVNDTLP